MMTIVISASVPLFDYSQLTIETRIRVQQLETEIDEGHAEVQVLMTQTEHPMDYYGWKQDVPKLKELWAAAKPLTEKMEQFNNFLADSVGLNDTLAFLWSLYHEQHRPKPAHSPVTQSAYLVDVLNDGGAGSGFGE